MILQELVRYYDRQRNQRDSDIAPPGWIRRPVDYVLVLQADGDCIDLQQRYTVEKGKRVGPSELLPAIGKQSLKHTNSGKDANLLWDNASFVLGVGDRGPLKLGSFIAAIDQWFSQLSDPGIAAVRAFLASLQQQPSIAPDLIERFGARVDFDERDPVLTFRLTSDGPVPVHEREGVRQAYAERADAALANAVRGRCLVTGADNAPLASNETVIKGVWNAQPAGANLVAFNAAAFVSYGKEGRNAENAPIGLIASSAYSTSLNHLLTSSRHRVQVGDASTVFWADGPSRFDGEFTLADFFGESKDDPDRGVRAVQALFESLHGGQLPVGERNVKFFVLGLAPNAARISVRFWLRTPLAELAPRIAQHFKDIKLIRRYDSDPIAPSLHRMMRSLCLREDIKHLPPRLAGEWVRAILEGLPYPALLLNSAVNRCKAEQDVTYLRAAVLKAWLNRDQRRQHFDLPADHSYFKETLDMEHLDVPYRLGRLFAVLERIQQQAMPGINATIRDRYYGAASTTPVAVFTTLLRLKNAHLKKLAEGPCAYFERLIGEVVEPMTDFPRQLTLPEQGRFALGYYHQRQAFFTRKVAADTTTTPEE